MLTEPELQIKKLQAQMGILAGDPELSQSSCPVSLTVRER